MSDIDISVKIEDAARLCSTRSIPKFVGFLSPAELAQATPKLNFYTYGIFGGYEGAERCFVGLFPDWCEEDRELYPITPITLTYRKQDVLSHRDFLGSVLALGLERSAVGDILIESGRAVMFVFSDIADYILSQLSKVGRVGVSLQKGYAGALPQMGGFLEQSTTVPSMRLDCVVGALTSKSRNTAKELITGGFVSLNSLCVIKPTANVTGLDTLSIRGYGKFTILAADEFSKKGRIILKWKKYI